jgi:signal transduction histidine kinase
VTRALAPAALGLAVLVALARVVVDLCTGSSWVLLPTALLPLDLVAGLAAPATGAILLRRSADARVGRLLVAVGLVVTLAIALFTVAHALLQLGGRDATGTGAALATASNSLFPFVYTWPLLVAVVFPDGHAASRAARGLFVAIALASSAVAASYLFSAPTAPAPYLDRANPLADAAREPALTVVFTVALAALLLAALCGAVLVLLRFRRATGKRRLELAWLALAMVLPPAALVTCVLAAVVQTLDPSVSIVLVDLAQLSVCGALLAASSHRLHSVEKVANGVLLYFLLTPILLAVLVVTALLGGLLVGRGSPVATAIATLLAAVAALPVRARLQALIDRRFAAAAVTAVALLREFDDDVHAGRRSLFELNAVLRACLGDEDARLLILVDDEFVDAGGGGPRPHHLSSEIRYSGSLVGRIEHSEAVAFAPLLRERVTRAAAPATEMLRLQLEVQRRLASVAESRSRIVEAGVQERRRLERDLHDGAQQRLVALGIRLRRMQRSLPAEAMVLEPALGEAVDHVAEAIADLRTIAAGVRPARLDEGLRAALLDVAATSPVRVAVDVPLERFDAGIEDASYFIACEAITNAIKHAGPCSVDVRGRVADERLVIVVRDDGVGGATNGHGVLGMGDRARALGGTLELTSASGAGTTVELTLPVGSR